MSYRTPGARVPAVKSVRDALLAARRAVLTTHINADGDGAGSEAAVLSWMRANGSEVWIVNPTPFPEAFRFLVENEDWILDAGSQEARDACAQADLAVVLDTGEVPRIGRVRSLIRELTTVVVDHHQPSEQPIGGISLRDPQACATGELVYDILKATNGPWTRQALEGLYIAILTDTGSFRFTNSTPGSHRMAAELIERGVDPEAMHARAYGASPLRRFQLLERALATLRFDEEAGVAWMIIPGDAMEAVGATQDDLEGMVDVPRGVAGAQVGLLFRLMATGEVKVSLRSNGPVDVNQLAHVFGGGGHIKASGAVVSGPMEEAVERVVGAVRTAALKTAGREPV